MKLTTGMSILGSRNIEKTISKKILLANTTDKNLDSRVTGKGVGASSDPLFNDSNTTSMFNPDIRYRNAFAFSPLTDINYRNELLLFSENNEIKKAVRIIANEIAMMDSNIDKYPVFPKINQTLITEDKRKVSEAIQEYLDKVFYPKLYRMLNLNDEGLIELLEEFIKTGKLCYEIVFDNLKRPNDIVAILPLDPSTIQKYKQNDFIYYVQKPLASNNTTRILHENQVIMLEFNKFDYGFVSYVDKLKISYNIMRSMMTSKIMWFATKSQVRMHIKLAMGDVGRPEAIQKLVEAKNTYKNQFNFEDDGTVSFNNKPMTSGYREFFTAETTASGTPEMEEVNTNGPDLTEVDSLMYWEKLFWKDTDIPYDRIDPNSSDSWGFNDVANLRKIEINFGKLINSFRKMINPMFMKPIVIQLTLKEAEIGVDLNLLDAIKMQWVAFNEYDKLAELEVLQKRVDIATAISSFGEMEDANGVTRKRIPLGWIVKNYMEFTEEQLNSMEYERHLEAISLGFETEAGDIITEKEVVADEIVIDEPLADEGADADSIRNFDDNEF